MLLHFESSLFQFPIFSFITRSETIFTMILDSVSLLQEKYFKIIIHIIISIKLTEDSSFKLTYGFIPFEILFQFINELKTYSITFANLFFDVWIKKNVCFQAIRNISLELKLSFLLFICKWKWLIIIIK